MKQKLPGHRPKIEELERFHSLFPWEPQHSLQVRVLSLKIFDQLKKIHLLGADERFILEGAALLHDIGFTVDAAKHHKHSRDLILQHDFKLLSDKEILLIALVARYHRKAQPKPNHKRFNSLDRCGRDMVLKLSGILRIADGLDRAHCKSVKDIEIVEKGNKLFFKIRSGKILPEDIYGANKKKDLFEKVLSKRVIIDIPA